MRIAVVVIGLVLAACGVSASGGDPLSPLPDSAAICLAARGGEACTTAGAWCRTSDQCGEEVRYCRCLDGHLRCTTPYSGEELASCAAVPSGLASCQLEGTGRCDAEPVGGGTCGCEAGHYVCHNACDGCPTTKPADGAACATANVCRYAGGTCACDAGGFHCAP